MSLLISIKADLLKARKTAMSKGQSDQEKTENQYVVSALTTLYSAAELVGKNAGRPTTDAEVIATVQKFLKSVGECIRVCSPGSVDERKYSIEQITLSNYLPKQLDQNQIEVELEVLKPVNLGAAMSHFKSKYPGQYDNLVLKAAVETFLKKGS